MDEENQGKLRRGYVDTQGLYDGLYHLADLVDARELTAIRGNYLALIDYYAAIRAFSERILPLIANTEIVIPKEMIPEGFIDNTKQEDETDSNEENDINPPVSKPKKYIGEGRKVKAHKILHYWLKHTQNKIDFSRNRIRQGTTPILLWHDLGLIKEYLHIAGLKSGALQKQDYERSARASVRETFR